MAGLAFHAKYVSFLKAAGTGVQVVSGVGFRGKALLVWTTYQAIMGTTTDALMCFGMTDGVLQSCRFARAASGLTTSAQDEQTDHILRKLSATSGAAPVVEVAGQFSAWTDDGFAINFLTNDGVPAICHAIVLGGDIEAAFTQVKMTVNSGQSINKLGVGFKPSAFIVMGGAADEFGAGDYSLGAPWGSIHGFGFSNAVENVCGWTLARGVGGAADCYRGQMTNAVASVRVANNAGAGQLMDARITASLDDGYTITRTAGGTSHQPVQHVLCLKNVKFALGSFTAPLTPGSLVVPVPFRPDMVLAQTVGLPPTINAAGMGLAFGAWQREHGVSAGTWIGGVDNVSPSVYRRAMYQNAIVESRNASTGDALMRASIMNATDTGIAVNFSAVSGAADQLIFMCLASTDPIPDPEPVPVPTPLPYGAVRIPIRRLRRAGILTADGADTRHDAFQLSMQVGVGNVLPPGVRPDVIMEYSDDAGMTWSDELRLQVGATGEYTTEVRWTKLGTAKNRVYQVWMADPVFWCIIGAYLDAQKGRF